MHSWLNHSSRLPWVGWQSGCWPGWGLTWGMPAPPGFLAEFSCLQDWGGWLLACCQLSDPRGPQAPNPPPRSCRVPAGGLSHYGCRPRETSPQTSRPSAKSRWPHLPALMGWGPRKHPWRTGPGGGIHHGSWVSPKITLFQAESLWVWHYCFTSFGKMSVGTLY